MSIKNLFNKAINIFKENFTDNKPKFYYQEALKYMDEGDYNKALESINKSIELVWDFDNSFYIRGCIFQNLERFEEAMQDFNKCVFLNPNNLEAFNNRGCCHYFLQKYEQSLEDYCQAIEIDPSYEYAYHNRGLSYCALNEFEKSLADYNKAISINGQYENAYINKALTLEKMEKFEEAINCLKKVLDFNPNSCDAYYHIGKIHFFNKDFELCKNNLDEAIRLSPQNDYLYNRRGLANFHLGNYNLALKDYENALILNPKNIDALFDTAYLYETTEKFDAALRIYNKVISEFDNSYYAYKNRSYVYYKLGEFEKALLDIEKAISINNQDPNLFFNRGLLNKELEPEKAFLDFDLCIQKDKNFIDAYIEKAFLFEDINEFENALKLYEKVLKLDYINEWIFCRLARTYRLLENYDKSEECIKKSLELKSDYSFAFYEFAILKLDQNLFEEAFLHFDECIEYSPEPFFANFNSGLCCLEKCPQKSIEYFLASNQINPKDCKTVFHIAKTYENLKEISKAKLYFEKLVDLDPENEDNIFDCLNFYKRQDLIDLAIEFLKNINSKLKNATFYNELGRIYHDLEQFDDAISSYKLALDIRPNFAVVYYNLSLIYKIQDEINLALDSINKSIELDKTDCDAFFIRGGLYCFWNNEYEKAISDYKKAIKLGLNDEYVYRNLAYALDNVGNVEKAKENLEKSLEINPDYCVSLIELGHVYFYDLKESEKAFELYDKAANLDPYDSDARFYRANVNFLKFDKNEAAIEDLKFIIEKIDSDYEKAYSLLGKAYVEIKDFNSSIEYLEKAIIFEPDNICLIHKLAISYLEIKNPNKALPILEKIDKIKTCDGSGISESFGDYFFQINEYKKALNYYEKALKECEENHDVYLKTAKIYKNLDDISSAKKLIDKIKPEHLTMHEEYKTFKNIIYS